MGISKKYIIEHRLSSARDFQNRGLSLHAIQVYYSIIKDEPDFEEAYFALTELFEKQGNISEAKDVLTNYLSVHPDNDSAKLYLAQFFLRNSMWEDVVNFIQSFDFNEEPIAAFFLGYSFFMLKDYEHARINFQHFIRLGKKTELIHETFFYLAKTEIELGNFKASLEYAKKAEVVYSNFWELNLLFAIIHFNLNMYVHSVSFIKKAFKLNANEPDVYKWGGKIFLRTGDYLKAEEYFLKYISMIENPASEIYSELGDVFLKTNKTADAFQYYNLALKLNPLNKQAFAGKNKAASILESGVNED